MHYIKRLLKTLFFLGLLYTNTASAQTININFQPSGTSTPSGYKADIGLPYDATRKYGWIDPSTKQPIDLQNNMRLRSGSGDFKQLSLVQMQATGNSQVPGTWEYAVTNGRYRVTVSSGDTGYYDSNNQINIDGLPAIQDFTSTSATKYRTATAVVQVNDGKLTIDAAGGVNTKMNYLSFVPATNVTDTEIPTVSARLSGTQSSGGVYSNQVKVYVTAKDNGAAGLASLQYAVNGGSYINYKSPFIINIAGAYTLKIKATDGNKNEKISTYSFKVTTAKVTGVYMSLKNMDLIPANDVLVFSLIQTPWRRTSPTTTPYNANHDKVKLRVYNKGTGKLNITNLKLSNTASWKIASVNGDTIVRLPFSVSSKAYSDVIVQYTAKNVGTRVKVLNDTLTVISNDSIAPTKKVNLHGIWQVAGESTNEPFAQQIISAFGYTTNTGYGHDDGDNNGTARVAGSSEVNASYFVQADKSKPVTVYQLAAYHSCCSAVESVKYFAKGSSSTTTLFTHNNLDGQSVIPRLANSSISPAQGTFNFSGSFGIKIGSSSSDRTQNYNGLIGIRFLKVMDAEGNIVPNAYILDCDYLGTEYTNYDYQDNVYYVDNIKPESGSLHYSDLGCTTSSDVNFANTLIGSTTSVDLTLKNMGKQYSDGTSDSDIKLTGVEIVGPNASEFSVGALQTSTLTVQATTQITAKFKPATVGIKNAAILVHYNSASSPLRIPLYGRANSSTATVSVVKRIKGGADANVTIDNKLFEADKSYRSGSIKLDMQVVKSDVAATDDELLYQTYLSAAADLAETKYAIPISNGNYLVRMHFVENYWTTPGARVFSIFMEDKQSLSNFDIYNEVGYRQALVKDFKVTVNDGVLSVKFVPTANRVAIAGLEIFKINTTQAASTMAVVKPTLIEEIKPVANLTVYPNPNSGAYFSINAQNLTGNEKAVINVINSWGRLVQTQQVVIDEQGMLKVQVTLGKTLERGVYIIQVASQSKTLFSKLLVD
ncbi:T9SS type A sorting domain-containing protein [Mucilaginibacter sp. ZT4R22]|uniref:T9SS type A sorting domain-containing protein n=1 Tax=Mucilaginibacter pankratovii TaxID=2772110 RepID=A0ABR7WTC1_9SPHI|nr:malectin domain-containing carbohydrate-binding protein [Mucilaginibacter pankratovii]MBD1365551.1 T9SS type A sorting domain-containing protein [Mucilaginibacter pankratovii]